MTNVWFDNEKRKSAEVSGILHLFYKSIKCLKNSDGRPLEVSFFTGIICQTASDFAYVFGFYLATTWKDLRCFHIFLRTVILCLISIFSFIFSIDSVWSTQIAHCLFLCCFETWTTCSIFNVILAVIFLNSKGHSLTFYSKIQP